MAFSAAKNARLEVVNSFEAYLLSSIPVIALNFSMMTSLVCLKVEPSRLRNSCLLKSLLKKPFQIIEKALY